MPANLPSVDHVFLMIEGFDLVDMADDGLVIERGQTTLQGCRDWFKTSEKSSFA